MESHLYKPEGVLSQCQEKEAEAVTRAAPVGELSQVSPVIPGVHTSFFYLCGRALGAPFTLYVKDYNLHSLNYLHGGAPKVWLIMEPSANHQLETLLHAYADKMWGRKWRGQPRCSQFARHMSVFVPLSVLNRWSSLR